MKLELVELSAGRGEKALETEAASLLSLQRPRERLVALDERGRGLTSLQLAEELDRAQSASVDLLFVVGGDEGLHPSVRARAHLVLALSAMTLPHRLARLVLVEQLYRAATILRGEPYHK